MISTVISTHLYLNHLPSTSKLHLIPLPLVIFPELIYPRPDGPLCLSLFVMEPLNLSHERQGMIRDPTKFHTCLRSYLCFEGQICGTVQDC